MDTTEAQRPGFAADFRVGGWLVEPSLDRVSRNGTVLRLRPQLMDLLVVLAERAGRTVSKETILATVWQGQHVAESGMTRCIAEIRQALEDDAREPTMIQTIPKRGYRLVAPVEVLDTQPAPAEDTDAAPPSSADDIAPPRTSTAPEEPDPALAAPDRAATPLAAPAKAPRLPRVTWTVGSLLGAMLLLIFSWGTAGLSRVPALTERDTVLLADVTNSTGDPAFDGTLRLALAVHLAQAPFLRILPDDHLRSAAVRSGRPRDISVVGPVALDLCRREAAAILLAASIARLGSHFAVGIEAIACRTGDAVGHELVEVERKEQVLSALGTAAARMRQRLGESRQSIGQYDVPIIEATTSSLDALRAVSAGDVSRDHARTEEALQDYRRATELDSQFALAWARRGAAAGNLGLADEAVQSLRRAYELRDRASEPERLYILGHYYRYVADEPEKAVEIYRTWQRVYPGSAVPFTNLASIFVNTFGRYDEAVPDAREAVRLAPYSSLPARTLVAAYLGTNRVAEARQALREAAARGIGDAVWHELAYQIAFFDGDGAGMAEQIRWAAGNPAAEPAMTRNRALAAASAGRMREARELWAEAASAAARVLPPVRQAELRLWEAETEALLGDPQRARRAAEAAATLHPQPVTLLDAATSMALAGDRDRAAALIGRAVRLIEPGICSRPVWLFVSQALVEVASGRVDRAEVRIGEAARYERGREFAFAPLGARALVAAAAGRPKDAVAAYRQILELRFVQPLAPWVSAARIGLARALGDAGDAKGSRAAYEAFVASMKTADAEVTLLAAGRRELAALAR